MYSIMIVDDEKAIRENLPRAVDFESWGFHVCSVAKNGEDALEKLSRQRVDVVFLDVCMPVLDGLGFLRKIAPLEEKDRPYVIMLSGYSDFEYARTAMRYGVRAYLTKPVDEEEVGQVLSELKEKLDERASLALQEDIGQQAASVREMYHSGDGDRAAYPGFLVLHCLVLSAAKQEETYLAAKEVIEERVHGGSSAFLRRRGSVFSWLVSPNTLAEYQHSAMLFGRHLVYQLKKTGGEYAVLLDPALFETAQGTFRNDHDAHLHQMMTEVFWNKSSVVVWEPSLLDGSEQRLEKEDAYLEAVKKAVSEPDGEKLRRVYLDIDAAVKKSRLNIAFLQELDYRIYYTLMDVLQEEAAEKAPKLEPMEWRESPAFWGYEEWKAWLSGQMDAVFACVFEQKKMKKAGVGEEAAAYVRRHFKEALSLNGVAEKFYVNPSYLGRSFQKATGKSFKQYLNDLRMEEAKRLLLQTDKLVYEIAQEVGFSESKYFVAKFAAQEGMSPAEYRKQQHLRKGQYSRSPEV